MSGGPDAVTQAVRAGLESDELTGAVVPPIHLSTTYAFRGFDDKRAYDYSRSGNPNPRPAGQSAGGSGRRRRWLGAGHRYGSHHAGRASVAGRRTHCCAS